MKTRIALITILTGDVPAMTRFYRDVLGFVVETDMGEYVEFASESVRFAVCARSIMFEATGDDGFRRPAAGRSFELAFPCASPAAVDEIYAEIVEQGATSIKEPADMPWGQRTAFFADPDGNVHELFADLPDSEIPE
ncbi:MAG: VOC family protein [Candidatus Promineifilaceae bacterium]|nr:VOC family protein [Candidatus Promineifilaceae bacterium]